MLSPHPPTPCVAESISPRGVAGAGGVQRLAPTQESLQHLVWEPGTLHRQTRGWDTHPPSQPRGKQRRTQCKRRKSNLSWAQFPLPPTWTWKCRLTVRMGRVAWILPWWDIQADLAWGHRRKEPINDKTRVRRGRASKRTVLGCYRPQYFFSYATSSLLNFHPIKAWFTLRSSHPQL